MSDQKAPEAGPLFRPPGPIPSSVFWWVTLFPHQLPAPRSPYLLAPPPPGHLLTLTPTFPSALACPANTVYQSCMTPCPASCAHPTAPRDCEGPCVEGCASLPGYVYSGARSLPLAHCGCTNHGVYYQVRAGRGRPCGGRRARGGGKARPPPPGPSPLSSGVTAL